MRPIDVAKAFGVAALVFVLDVLIAIALVYGWAIFIEPGHDQSYYETAALPIARWSTRSAGTALMFGAAWFSARRRPQRNAYVYAALLVFFYAFIDGVSAAFVGFFTLSIALAMLLKLIGALAGAYLARTRRSRAPPIRDNAPIP
ncbi:MAG: hypothetical protein ACLPV8_01445 [Steroidobacteraceae bacterium]